MAGVMRRGLRTVPEDLNPKALRNGGAERS
jgi:hypothetical protein